MSYIQQKDRKAAFIFVRDLNAHHQEWFGLFSGTDRHGVAAYDFFQISLDVSNLLMDQHID